MHYPPPLYPLPLLLLLLTPSLSQDISFPSSGQEPRFDAETFQVEDTNSQVLYPSASQAQPMIEPLGGSSYHGDNVSRGVVDLGLQIHRRVRGGESWNVYSPTSIASALYMVLLGANGKTYTELSNFLGVNSISSSIKPHEDFTHALQNIQSTEQDKNIVKVANALFVQNEYPIRPDYRNLISSLYQSTVQSLDFRNNASYARDFINSWVSERTMGKIPEILVSEPTAETKIILTSSLYFKGEWTNPFPTELTKLRDFYPNGRSQPSTLKVPFMATQSTFKYYQDPQLNCEVVGIPYKEDNIIFYLILPRQSNWEKLKSLENLLTSTDLQQLLDSTVDTANVLVAIPKMKLSNEYDIKFALQDLGVRALFSPKEADLSLLSSTMNIPKQPPGVFEEEDKFVFTRMKKVNVSEERRKREVKTRVLNNPARKIQNSTFTNRHKRQIKSEDSPSRGILPMGRSDNNVESRHLRILGNPGLYVNKIIHKVVVEINEKGTEAAATTLVNMERTNSYTVKADAPFMFFIRHENTKMILFWGSVIIPPTEN